MLEIAEEVSFVVPVDEIVFHTMMDGDTLVISGMALPKEDAAALAWLINHPTQTELKVKIKLKT